MEENQLAIRYMSGGLAPGGGCFLELFWGDMVCRFKMQGKVVGICVSYRLGNLFKCKAARFQKFCGFFYTDFSDIFCKWYFKFLAEQMG